MNAEYKAAMESLTYANSVFGMSNVSSDFPKADYDHLSSMASKMATMDDVLKRNRYLGWIQACICIFANERGEEALQDLKDINRDAFHP